MLANKPHIHLSIVLLPAIIISVIDPVVYADHSYNFWEALAINLGAVVLVVLFIFYFLLIDLFSTSIEPLIFTSIVIFRLALSMKIYFNSSKTPKQKLTSEIALTVLSLIIGRIILIVFVVG